MQNSRLIVFSYVLYGDGVQIAKTTSTHKKMESMERNKRKQCQYCQLSGIQLMSNNKQQQWNCFLIEYLRISEKSSTSIMWPSRGAGDRSRTECTVLNRTDQASLWKQMIISVGGRSSIYRPFSLHLNKLKFKKKTNEVKSEIADFSLKCDEHLKAILYNHHLSQQKLQQTCTTNIFHPICPLLTPPNKQSANSAS